MQHTAFRDEVLERLRIQAAIAQLAFRMLVLANGGAIVALFTLMGSGSPIANRAPNVMLWLGFGLFASGLVFTIGALVCGFFMQLNFTNATLSQMWNKEHELLGVSPQNDVNTEMRRGSRWEVAAVALTVLGLVGFVGGAAFCFAAFL